MNWLRAVVILGILLGRLQLVWAEEGDLSKDNHEVKPGRQRLNLATPTVGGKQFWTDLFVAGKWRIQRNAFTGHCRLLDDKDVRRAWGTLDVCRSQFDTLKAKLELPPVGKTVLVTLHGLGRSRSSMAGIGQYLADKGGYSWINVSYASTRGTLEAHAQALASVLDHLEGVEQVDFVAHSLGNLVIRRYLTDRAAAKSTAGRPRLGRIVMLAPPNNSAALAVKFKDNKLFRLIAGVSGTQLAEEWEQLEASLATPHCQFGIIAGGRGKRSGSNPLLAGDDDLIVTVEETRLAGAHDFLVVPAWHTYIMDDQQVKQCTLRFLQHGYFVAEDKRQPIASE